MNARILPRLLITPLLAGLSVGSLLGAAPSRPNVVVVLFDDLGWGQPPSYVADSALRTPRLDRLAAEGMRFTDAHSAAAVCTPTRYGLLTGRYPSRIGQFGVLTTYSPPIIPPTRLTIGSLLKRHGYHTACIGKWHLGMTWVDGKPGNEREVPIGARITGGPNELGFDEFLGFTHARNIRTVIEQDRVARHVAPEESQPLMIRRAVEYLAERSRDDSPFLLYFPMCPPHEPIVPAAEFLAKSGAEDVVRRDPKYGDWLFQGDAMLGELLDALERHGLAGNTLVIATSDNGAEQRAYAPLRESKRSIYEGGHRVPFVARWPGHVSAGSVCDATICLNDVLATCAELVDAKLPDDAGEDSVSLLPLLLGETKVGGREATIHQSAAGDLAIRQGAWKLVFRKGGARELYDLASDLGETRDLAETRGEMVEQLSDVMRRHMLRGRSTAGADQPNDAPVLFGDSDNDGKPRRRKQRTPR